MMYIAHCECENTSWSR